MTKKITESVVKRVALREANAKAKYEEARADLEEVIWEAQEQGRTITWIAQQIPQMKRPAVHYVLAQMAGDRGGTKNDRVREWARQRGYPIGDVSAIPQSLITDYDNHIAQQENAK